MGRRHSSYENTDWHQQEESRFAVRAAKILERTGGANNAGIIVPAPSHTLGLLRKHRGRHTRRNLAVEIDKDFTHRTTQANIGEIAVKCQAIWARRRNEEI